MSIKFAKYYDVTKLAENMLKDKKLNCYSDIMKELAGIYICSDINDFWICRIQKNLNEEYEYEEGTFLIERNKIDNWDVIDKVCELRGRKTYVKCDKVTMNNFIDTESEIKLFEAVLTIDDERGFENWDCSQHDSLEECLVILADIYGIEEIDVA